MISEDKNIDLVMLVDDNDTDNFISKRIIEITKFANAVEIKNSGKSALEYLEKHKDDAAKLPDIIFLDINMPSMTGWEFLEEFRQLGETVHQHFIVYILTSSVDDRDKEKAEADPLVAGFFSKPLTATAVHEAVGRNAKKSS